MSRGSAPHDAAGGPGRATILHELFRSGHNTDRLDKAGLPGAVSAAAGLTWSGEAASGEACLRLLAWAMESKPGSGSIIAPPEPRHGSRRRRWVGVETR